MSSTQAPKTKSGLNDRYADAASFIPPTVNSLVRNATVKPHWVGDRDHFWYRRKTAEGSAFVLVDPQAGLSAPAFDHESVAAALSELYGLAITASALPITALDFSPDLSTVRIWTNRTGLSLDRKTGRFTIIEPIRHDPGRLAAPDGKQATFCRDDNIWVRDLASGAERPLSTDGADHFSYGKLPDANFSALLVRRGALTLPPHGTLWSPDSRWLIVTRVDEREVASYPFMIWAPPEKNRPEMAELRRPLLADGPGPARRDFIAIDVASCDHHALRIPDGLNIFVGRGSCWWDSASTTLYTTAQDLGYRHAVLLAVDLRSGDARIVIDEHAATHHDYNLDPYRVPNVHVLKDGAEIIWFSQRDGWGHLYLYDGTTGRVIRQVTKGPWAVFDIIRVDETRRDIYFTAGGREAGRNPYYRHLYRVALDGGEPVLLTPENADHDFRAGPRAQEAFIFFQTPLVRLIAPSACYVIDTFSTIDTPPVTVLRATTDGSIVMILEKADISALTALGYTPPVPFIEKADDGVTDIYGQIYFPPDTDPSRRYPVVDAIVAGPQQHAVQHQFVAALWDWIPPASLALSRSGFIVVQIEGRGSPHRDKAFHDFAYGRLAENGLIDHVAILKRLGDRYPAMDLDRVGAYGYSMGAYLTMRALLDYPAFFKAGVVIGCSFNFEGQLPYFVQKWQGPVATGEVPESYRELDCRRLTAQLEGKLLMVAGELDDVTPAALTLQMSDALITAAKDFELLIMTGHDHFSMAKDPYVARRIWDFFLRHLT